MSFQPYAKFWVEAEICYPINRKSGKDDGEYENVQTPIPIGILDLPVSAREIAVLCGLRESDAEELASGIAGYWKEIQKDTKERDPEPMPLPS